MGDASCITLNYNYALNQYMVNPTKVTAVAVLSTSRNIIQTHQTLVIMTAVLYTAQSLTQLHQTVQKSSLKRGSMAVIVNRPSD